MRDFVKMTPENSHGIERDYQKTKPCAVCSKIQIPDAVDDFPSARVTTSHHSTFESFKKSFSKDCYICMTIWNRMGNPSQQHDNWLSTAWKPMGYWVQKDGSGRSLYKLNITYPPSPSSKTIEEIVQFRLTPLGLERLESISAGDIGDSTGGPSSISLAKGWLLSCQSQHAQCHQYAARSKEWHPKRLIDLGNEGDLNWKLYNTNENGVVAPPVSYITLSYRWGAKPKLLLLRSTIESFRLGRPFADLPKTFRDLTKVARHFGVRYVWIDALCIIQDSKSDWEMEALTMRDVYANALFTVAASASEDEDGGLFRIRNGRSVLPGRAVFRTASSDPKAFCMFERDYWDRNILAGPLHKRGWVFQERHLSSRVLYFGPTQILWECFETAKCEGFPDGVPFHWFDKNLCEVLNLFDEKTMTVNLDSKTKIGMPISAYSLWRDLVKKYTQCSLSRPSDKLPAFAGIAKFFQEATGDEYIAGLWRSRILDGLDWRVTGPVRRASSKYRAPSWSWASVDSPLKPELPGPNFKHLLEFIDVRVQTQHSDATGGVVGGQLKVRGLLFRAIVEEHEERGRYRVVVYPGHHVVRSYSYSISLRFCFDHEGISFSKGQVVFLLPLNSSLRRYQSIEDVQVVFLILVLPAGGKQASFCRVGHFILTDPNLIQQFGLHSSKDGLIILGSQQGISTITII